LTERRQGPDQDVMSEDVASLYSQAHKRGTGYWDFSASRADMQRQFRLRIPREHVEQFRPGPPSPLHRAYREPVVHRVYESGVAGPLEAPMGLAMDFEAPFNHFSTRPPAAPMPPAESGFSFADFFPAVTAAQEEAAVRQTLHSRWHTLRSVFEAERPVMEPSEMPGLKPGPPTTIVFSLAGGVGKTCLVATLGRALSALGEHVLLSDTEADGLLPFYFGSGENRPGAVRTFPPTGKGKIAAPVQVLSLLAEHSPRFENGDDPLLGDLALGGRGMSRILIDLATSSRELASRLLPLRPVLLVPVLPDVQSVASLKSLEVWLANENRHHGNGGIGIRNFYVLNQFDSGQALHLDIREMLQQRLGDRLLPFELHRSSAVSEALAAGMTVIDYTPESAIAEDYRKLASWVQSFGI
jgi:cellulose synthase operon protein YhjQ